MPRRKRKKPEVRFCNRCRQELPIDDFYIVKRKGRKTGSPKPHCIRCQRWVKIEEKYGLTEDDWWALFAAQDGKDPISLADLDPDTCHVDHCHVTGIVRGLLEPKINRALGFFKDDPESMRRGADYLDGIRPIQQLDPEGRWRKPVPPPDVVDGGGVKPPDSV